MELEATGISRYNYAMKTILTVFIFLIMNKAHALTFNELPPLEDGTQILDIYGGIDIQTYPDLNLKTNARIFIKSPGGNPDQVQKLTEWFKSQIQEKNVTVIMKDYCASTCIPFLSAINSMAGTGEIKLVLDKNLRLGFHGCYNARRPDWEAGCTRGMMIFMSKQGVNEVWFEENMNLFARPYPAYMVWLNPESEKLNESSLINNAEIEVEAKKYLTEIEVTARAEIELD